MTVFFQYDTLTWPEVAGLPRDIPLILPLGEGYAFDHLSSALGGPLRAGLLPPFPFGWQDSGLVVPEAILGATLENLLDSLRDDGFSRVYALTPQGIDLGLGASRIALPRGIGNVTVLAAEGRVSVEAGNARSTTLGIHPCKTPKFPVSTKRQGKRTSFYPPRFRAW